MSGGVRDATAEATGGAAAAARPAAAALPPWRAALEPLRQRWSAFAPRERRALAAAGGVLALALVWLVAVQPAWRTLQRAAAEAPRLEQQWQTMQRLAREAQELRAAPPPDLQLAAAALQAASDRLGPAGRLSLQGERAVLTLQGVGPGALREWLAEARTGARARVVEASLVQAGQGYSGTVVVAFGAAP
jgi:general secretion pathway protein M